MTYHKFYCRFCGIYAFDYYPIDDNVSRGGINYKSIKSWTAHITFHMPFLHYDDINYPREFVRMYRSGEKVTKK